MGTFHPSLIAFGLLICCASNARGDILQKRVKSAADLAKQAAKGDSKKYIETFSAAIQGPEALEGAKLADTLARKRNGALLSRNTPADSIYENPRFRELYPILIGDSAKGRRIFGGKPAKPGEFDACVAVGNDDRYYCSGTLIGKRLVCTAGHCFDEQPSRIFVGNSISNSGREYRIKSGGIIRHPAYHRGQSPHNDLTVLILEEDVDGVSPMKIADSASSDAMKIVRIVGFGNTDKEGSVGYGTKNIADVVVVSPDGIRYNSLKYGADAGLEFVAEDRRADSCTGDSGGPAFLEDGDTWKLTGATSRATLAASAECGDGGIYVRMDKYLPWIQRVARANHVDAP